MRRSLLRSFVATAVAAFAAVTLAPQLSRTPAWLEHPIRYAAGFTFALYLLHYPLLQFFAALTAAVGLETYRTALVALGPLTVVWALGGAIERQSAPQSFPATVRLIVGERQRVSDSHTGKREALLFRQIRDRLCRPNA